MAPRSGDALDRARLRTLAEHLAQTPAMVARTLHDELIGARAEIDRGLADGDLEVIGHGTHAARNSALMIEARPALAELRALQAAVTAGELAKARDMRQRVAEALTDLVEALDALDR